MVVVAGAVVVVAGTVVVVAGTVVEVVEVVEVVDVGGREVGNAARRREAGSGRCTLLFPLSIGEKTSVALSTQHAIAPTKRQVIEL